jgi:hypothetical protein
VESVQVDLGFDDPLKKICASPHLALWIEPNSNVSVAIPDWKSSVKLSGNAALVLANSDFTPSYVRVVEWLVSVFP